MIHPPLQRQHRQGEADRPWPEWGVRRVVGTVALYFVPRDRAKSQAEGYSGLIGGLEVLGEIVLSSPEEKARLSDGRIDYFTLEAALASVHTPMDVD